jgi:hypothetical protein
LGYFVKSLTSWDNFLLINADIDVCLQLHFTKHVILNHNVLERKCHEDRDFNAPLMLLNK